MSPLFLKIYDFECPYWSMVYGSSLKSLTHTMILGINH
ncbi:hypothetical protein SSP1992 [Staphylococcus saprophyticus subsp. saprophyticus ATCC 15305]|uniref:Uncharacterized protein n=1 Tax=Staphylococcus saprophyticus subsp. saprophyticus (strain ATCC 15305 / DSM 20229 / NCIMB 8711 / NCTC 7292 / S-41) TaxID=342451 RepID=Q49VS3_STAS1|nr:hypothetical protein SSP1992 [Staphylococcus saprophyticus subsp. saprophyticus ATCC 15305] [Staphylococcus saprophyticus subsp. saprophyticus ATCC 15305 = NCTC 7292]